MFAQVIGETTSGIDGVKIAVEVETSTAIIAQDYRNNRREKADIYRLF